MIVNIIHLIPSHITTSISFNGNPFFIFLINANERLFFIIELQII
nr:MAG TPA: hypothetical protein [Bacteriophage sp.]DAI57886.1 MAG TPA: hypothetical protein [Caudoviricetes sp.]